MAAKDLRNYSLYTGCLIPSRYPFIEQASRRVLEALGLTLHAIEGASCCPNQMAVQSSDKTLWYVLAARNLALAERGGWDVLSLCNGCYDTLKSVRSKLLADDALRSKVNAMLAEQGLEFAGSVDVKHVVQVLRDDVGPSAIERAVTRPLRKLRVAPFPGCHVRRPGDHMGFDDPEEPHYLRDLVRALDGQVVPYHEEGSCCGGGFSIGRQEDVVPAARRVLQSVSEARGEVLVVNCPYCFSQLLTGERKANDIYFERRDTPVLYITELMGLAMGIPPEELGMPMHYRMGTGKELELVARITDEAPTAEVFDGEVTLQQLETCARCLACTDDCPTAMTVPEYRPERLLQLVLDGRWEEAVRQPDIWYCINCHECVERCPQGFGMVKLLVRLKNMAVERGVRPEVIDHRLEELAASGFSFAPDAELRSECGLGEVACPDVSELRRLMEQAGR